MLRSKWLVAAMGLVLALVGVLGLVPGQGVSANEVKGEVQVRLVIDGKVVGAFTSVSGLESEVEVVEMVCRVRDGRDNDCDGDSVAVWQAEVLAALWGIEQAASELEEQAWFSSRAKHDIAMNAIRNIKARVHEAAHVVQQAPTVSARHDTSKNAIGNIRALYRVLNSIAIDEEGLHVAMRTLGGKIEALNEPVAQWTVKKKPGRTTYANITLEAPLGQNKELAALWNDMANGRTGRRSGSIIYLDRAGNEVLRYNLFECFPVKFSSSMSTEKIEIAVEKVERAK